MTNDGYAFIRMTKTSSILHAHLKFRIMNIWLISDLELCNQLQNLNICIKFKCKSFDYIIITYASWQLNHISMASCKIAVTPLPKHWSYCSLALSHRYVLNYSCSQIRIKLPAVIWTEPITELDSHNGKFPDWYSINSFVLGAKWNHFIFDKVYIDNLWDVTGDRSTLG